MRTERLAAVTKTNLQKQTCFIDVRQLYMRLAHMAQLVLPLFINGQRIDRLWNDRHKQALADYHANNFVA